MGKRSRRVIAQLGLLGRFSVLSFACLLILGVVLSKFAATRIHERALATSAEEAELITRFGILPQISGADMNQRLAPEAIAALDEQLRTGVNSYPVHEITIWNGAGRVVYSSDTKLIGVRRPAEPGLQQALLGRTATHAGHDSDDGPGPSKKVIEAFVPLRFGGPGAPPDGAFEVYLDYAPVAKEISADAHRVFAIITLGLLAVWAALFRIVQGASRRLRRQAADHEYQARHDVLTGLANRGSFYELVERALVDARAAGRASAVMIVDLDRFKEVNDTLGHHSGDILLKQAARRLQSALREGDALARLGGDEFAVLLPVAASVDAASNVATRICEELEQPFMLGGLTVHLDASVGIALSPAHGDDVETLIQRADVAMYLAKGSAGSIELYRPELDRHSPARLAMLGELRQALDNSEFLLHYQPKANLRTGEVGGVEALVRWRHPERGMVPPDDFIPLAEQTGVIKPLTVWVIETALAQCRDWLDTGLDLTVAVNLSVRNLLDAHLPESIAELLRKYELPPTRLELEITESTIVADQVRTLDVLSRLNAMGVGLAVDDFGTGYSSLAYLKDLPVRALKIDRTFVNNMTEDGNDAFIVRSTIDLGRNLGLEVVAEGVETQEAWDQLGMLGCDLAQGYFLSRPLPADQLTAWLGDRAGLASAL